MKPDSNSGVRVSAIRRLRYARPGPLGFELLGFDPRFVEPGFVDPGFEGLVDPGFVLPGFEFPGFDPGFKLPLFEFGVVGLLLGVVPGVPLSGDVDGGCVVLFGALGLVWIRSRIIRRRCARACGRRCCTSSRRLRAAGRRLARLSRCRSGRRRLTWCRALRSLSACTSTSSARTTTRLRDRPACAA